MPGCSWRGHLRGAHIHYCPVFLEGTPVRGTYSLLPGVLGGDTWDTCEGYIFITARVFLEGTPVMGTYGFHYCPGVLGGDTYDGYIELYTMFSTLAGKLRWRGRSWVFDLNKSDLCPSFVEGLTTNEDPIRARRGGLRVGEEGTSSIPKHSIEGIEYSLKDKNKAKTDKTKHGIVMMKLKEAQMKIKATIDLLGEHSPIPLTEETQAQDLDASQVGYK
ncbi:hypothetical protein Tco_0865353 [Tanacetum coccineum]